MLRFSSFIALIMLLGFVAGCKEQSTSSGMSVKSTAPTKEVTVEITGMSCAKGCVPRARDAIASLPWAKDVKVDFEKKQGTFVAEVGRYDEAAVLKVLSDEGFEAKILK